MMIKRGLMDVGSKLARKLRSKGGETIAETLIALLISSLALVMLAGAISSAANIITRSENVMKVYYEKMSGLGSPGTDGLTVTVKNSSSEDLKLFDVNDDDTYDTEIPLKYAVNDAIAGKPIVSYVKK